MQIAGAACGVCNDRVVSAIAGVGCGGCGGVFHSACLLSDRCPTCRGPRARPEDARVRVSSCLACGVARVGREEQCVCGGALAWDDAAAYRAAIAACHADVRRSLRAGFGGLALLVVAVVGAIGAFVTTDVGLLLLASFTRAALACGVLLVGVSVMATTALRRLQHAVRVRESVRRANAA